MNCFEDSVSASRIKWISEMQEWKRKWIKENKKRKKKVQWIMLKAIKVVKLDVFTTSWSHLKDKANGLLHKYVLIRFVPVSFSHQFWTKKKKNEKKNMVTPSNFQLQVNFSVLLLFTVICVRKSIKTINKMYWYGSKRWKWWQEKKRWKRKKKIRILEN